MKMSEVINGVKMIPNFEKRTAPRKNDSTKVVITATCGDSLLGALNWMAHPGSNFAPHFVVDFDGSIVQTLPLDRVPMTVNSTPGNQEEDLAVAIVNHGRFRSTTAGIWLSDFGNVPAPDVPMIEGKMGGAWIPVRVEQVLAVASLVACYRAEFNPPKFSVLNAIPDAFGSDLMIRGFKPQ